MPAFDFSIEKLQTYTGSSPCPDDIDQFWDRNITEMKALDFQVELIPSKFQFPNAEAFELYFTGVDGARVHAKYLRPKNISKPIPSVIEFHGYGYHSGEWSEKLSWLNSGFAIASMDCRGQGGNSQDTSAVLGNTLKGHIIRGIDSGPDALLFKKIFLDTAQLANILMSLDEVDETRLAAIGGSQGGALALACAALEPKIKLCAPHYPFLSDYQRVWDMDLDQNAYEELRNYFRYHDPLHERKEQVFNTLGYIDIQNITKRIKAKTFMACGLMDQICPPSSQHAAYNKITAEKDIVYYPDFAHERLPSWADRVHQFILSNINP
ncbi:acetylxylan esterase [Lentisphaera marina]|uniref:alpha/beta fold hydrolase n=1 Tax=Lentisphaera marina TaxID=1111041 RepID=UPI00236509CE|nr:alpha/beta fold hydrolase [Lentisphaera marina]MDD7984675.1 acetylxylan esterase [Lentisphaera marina]